MGLLRRFQPNLPRSSLLFIHKTFIRSQLDFADVIYDKPCNSSFDEKLESIQYNACLEITGAIRGTPSEKLYQEVMLESLKSRHYLIWFLTWTEFVKPDIAIIFLQFMQDIIISRIHSFLLLYLNGTIVIAKLETQEVSQFLTRTC